MDALTLMTWNVRYFGHGTRGLWASDGWLRRLARAIASHSVLPDVIALQEVEAHSLRAGHRGEPQLRRFEQALHAGLEEVRGELGRQSWYRALYFPAHRYELGGATFYTTGLAVLLGPGVELDHHEVFDITHVRMPRLARLKQRRISAHVRLRVGDSVPLDLFNTHLSLPAFFEVGVHRIADRMGWGSNQLAETQRLLSHVEANAARHAVIVGDFNALPGSPVYDHVVGSGLLDAFADVHGLGVDELHARPTAGFFHKRMHIDHVFSTPGVQWLAFEDHAFDRKGPFRGLSDHAPKIGRLRLV